MTYIIACILDLLAIAVSFRIVTRVRAWPVFALAATLSVLLLVSQIAQSGRQPSLLDQVVAAATSIVLLTALLSLDTFLKKKNDHEAALCESERKYRSAFDNAPLGIYQNTLDGKVILVNEKLAEIVGAPSSNYAVENFNDIAYQFYVNPAERALHLSAALATGGYVTREIEEKRLDGTVFTALSRMRVVRNDNGEPLYVEGYLEDVTEQKRALEALQEASAFDELTTKLLADFASCPSSAIDAHLAAGLQLIAEFMNFDHGAVFLISDDRQTFSCTHEFCGSTTSSIYEAFQNRCLQELAGRMPESDHAFNIDGLNPMEAATLISDSVLLDCVSSCFLPILGGDCEIKGVLKLGAAQPRRSWKQTDMGHLRVVAEAIANVLQRARTESALVVSEQNYRGLFQTAPIGIFQSTLDGRLYRINDELAKMLGYPSSQEALRVISESKPQIYVEPELRQKLVADTLLTDGFVTEELRFYKRDGTEFDVSISARAVRHRDGSVACFEGFVRDISEAKEAASSLQRRYEIDLLITSIVAEFAACEAKDVDASVNKAVEGLAREMHADHAYVFMTSPDGKFYGATHEWAGVGVTQLLSTYQNIPFGSSPEVEKTILSDQVVNITVPADNPELTQEEIEATPLEKLRHSVLRVPIHGKAGMIAGVIGMVTYGHSVSWTESDIAKLRIAGDAIAGVLERKHAEEAAHRQAEYDELISSTLARFATSGADDIDYSVETALRDIARCFRADNSYLTLFSDDMTSYSCTHEWVEPNYEPNKSSLQNVPMGTVPWIESQILSDNVVFIDPLGSSDRILEFSNKLLGADTEIKSLLVAPVHGVAGTIIGMVGLNCFEAACNWTDRDIAQLRLSGDALANVIERKRADLALKQTAEFDELIARLLAGFATCQSSELDQTIRSGIGEIARYIGADQAHVTVVSFDRRRYSCAYEWCAEGAPSVKYDQQNVPMGTLPWSEKRLLADRPIVIWSLDDLPAQAVEERDSFYVRNGYSSIMIVPIRNGDIIGSIGLAAYRASIAWKESDLRHLKVVGDAIASMIDRRRAEDEVRSLNASLEQRIIRRTSDLEEARRNAIDIMNDVDEQRRRAEEALSQLEYATEHLRLLSQAVDNSPAMVMITDYSLLIEYVNPKFTEVTGYLPEEVLGKNPSFLSSNSEFDAPRKLMAEALANQKPWSGELCSRRKNGDLFWEYASFAPIKGLDGEVRHYVAVKEDISERKAMQDELGRSTYELTLARDAAEEANRTKSLFLANMSHEIRTPMNAILGFSQLLQNSDDFIGVHRQHLDIINRSGEHLLALINDILEMSKIEAGRVVTNPTVVDLLALIGDLSIMFRMRCADKNISFTVDADDGLPRYVLTDENKLRQILTNLLGNAVKLTENGGVIFRVVVEAGRRGRSMLIAEVEDSGPGIAEEERHKVFKPFEQTMSGIRARSGTGLGLAISQQFAQMLDGEISYVSQVDVGSTFRLAMPIEEIADLTLLSEPSKRRVIGLDPSCAVRRVLVVDDEPENRVLLSSMLAEVGFETLEAAEGNEAVDCFKKWKPDVVLMDAQMPGLDGYEAIRTIRSMTAGKSVPIIAVSASAFDEDRRRMLDAGADEFLPKPIRIDTVYASIGTTAGAVYRYREDISADPDFARVNPSASELRESVASLPANIVNGIREATIDADFDRVISIVDRITEVDSSVTDSLRVMAEQYEAARIISLLTPES